MNARIAKKIATSWPPERVVGHALVSRRGDVKPHKKPPRYTYCRHEGPSWCEVVKYLLQGWSEGQRETASRKVARMLLRNSRLMKKNQMRTVEELMTFLNALDTKRFPYLGESVRLAIPADQKRIDRLIEKWKLE